MTYKFSQLMKIISEATVPAFLAEHVFANKSKIAEALQKEKYYAFFSPIGEKIEIRWDGND